MYGRTPKSFRMASIRKANREEWRDRKAATVSRPIRREAVDQFLGELLVAAQNRRA